MYYTIFNIRGFVSSQRFTTWADAHEKALFYTRVTGIPWNVTAIKVGA